jgi:O-antigen ligase
VRIILHNIHRCSQKKDYLYLLLKLSVFISLFFSLTGISKGGDLKNFTPFFTFILTVAYIIYNKKVSLLRTPVFYSMIAYVAVSYFLLPFSVSPPFSFESLNKELLSGFFIFAGVYAVARYEEEDRLGQGGYNFIINSLVFMLLILSVSGFVALMLAGENISSRDILNLKSIKFRIHHNEFAMIANLMLPFVIFNLISANTLFKKYIFLGIAAFSVIVIFMNISRGGWVAMIVIFLLWIFLIIKRYKKFRLALFASALIIISVAGLWITSHPFRERVKSTLEHAKTITGRTHIWSIYIEGIKQSPITGWGYGNKIAWYKSPIVLDGKEKEKIVRKEITGFHAHNMILDVFFDQGIIGLIFFLILIGINLFYIIRTLQIEKEYYKLLSFTMLTVFVGVFIIHGLIESIPFKLIAIVSGLVGGLTRFTAVQNKLEGGI